MKGPLHSPCFICGLIVTLSEKYLYLKVRGPYSFRKFNIVPQTFVKFRARHMGEVILSYTWLSLGKS